MRELIRCLVRERHAQDLMEYALLGGLIALGVLIAMRGATLGLNTQYVAISSQVTSQVTGGSASGGTEPASEEVKAGGLR